MRKNVSHFGEGEFKRLMDNYSTKMQKMASITISDKKAMDVHDKQMQTKSLADYEKILDGIDDTIIENYIRKKKLLRIKQKIETKWDLKI